MVILYEVIRIYHECEGGIEKSVPSIFVWHQEACQVMTNGDHKRWIILSNLQLNKELIFLLSFKCHIFIFKKRLPEVSECTEM